VTSESEAVAAPELAVLSAIAHGKGERAAEVGRAALAAAARLDDEKRTQYTDFVLRFLSDAARGMLEIEMALSNFEFESEFFRGKIETARAEGEARAILEVLAARGLGVPEEVRQRILACTDLATLTRWVRRAVTAATPAEVVEG
jgi:hypothetical protein